MTLTTRLLVALTVVAQLALALMVIFALLAVVWPRARRWFGQFRAGLRQGGLGYWLAWIAAAVATGGSLYFSEVLGFVPCQLCWFQRICIYPLAVILLVAAIRRDRAGVWYALPFPIVGMLVSLRHIYIEVNPDAESTGCKIGGGGCATRWVDALGYITIPVMALSAAAFILALLLIIAPWGDLRRRRRGAHDDDASADYA